ncbi:MAG TPA: metallopeptidase TldD-related protein [Thermoclostridium sp.]
MIRELYQKTVRETSINITNSAIDSVRKKSIMKSGCRVYDNGFIGVAGTFGEPTEKTWAEAEERLKDQIPYPFEPEKNRKRVRDLRQLNISDEEFIKEMEDLLKTLNSEYPDFIFSHKINICESEISLKNDAGLDYVNYDKTIEYVLLVKHRDSINIIDSGLIRQGRTLQKKEFIEDARMFLDAFRNEVSLPQQGKIPVIVEPGMLLSKINESLNGEQIGFGTSLFCNKINTKVFNSDLHIIQDRTEEKYHTPFFDTEGVTQKDDVYYLVRNGVIEKAYTDKMNAKRFSMPLTGSASGDYDEVPSLSSADLSIVPGKKTLKELINGGPAILVIMASGGDYTSSGDFASPVQMAYLTDGEKIIGKLPEFNISGNLYEIFGDDFIGMSCDRAFMGEKALVVKMNVNY